MNKSDFAEKIDLASLKSEVDKLDIAKTKTVPTDLSKLSNVIHSNVIKKTAHDGLVKKVNTNDSDKQNLEKTIKDID